MAACARAKAPTRALVLSSAAAAAAASGVPHGSGAHPRRPCVLRAVARASLLSAKNVPDTVYPSSRVAYAPPGGLAKRCWSRGRRRGTARRRHEPQGAP
jgi:hypothetical protein